MNKTMKALVKAKPEPGLWMEQVPVPETGPNDVLVRIKKTAICGTDIHIWNWDEFTSNIVPVPMVVGHEFFGEIVETGTAVTKYIVGQRISGEGHIICGTCRNCRAGRGHLCRNTLGIGVNIPGAFAEYLCLPEDNVVPIPEDIDDEIASIFDPFGNAVHTALTFDCVGEDVLVTGAGPIGIMGALVVQKIGARKVVITDINPSRLKLAEKMGLNHVINPQKEDLIEIMQNIGLKEGFDIGLEMSGAAPAFQDMIDKMNNGGKIAILGLSSTGFDIDWNKVIFKMLRIQGIYGREMFETWYKMIAMVQSGLDLSPLITHRFPIDDFEEGFATMLSGNSGKVVLDWNSA